MAAESAHSPQPHFVVAATGTYAHWPPLPEAVADADKIADLLAQREMKTDRLIDRTEQQLLQELESLLPPTNGEPSGVLVVFCSGHGEPTPRSAGLRLIASDSAKGATAKITANYVIEVAARSGSAQILLIFDTCYAGTANPGMSIASAVLGDKPPGELWVGLLTSTMDWEKARDGRFGKLLASLIEHGPTSAEGKLRWSIRNEGITGDALICGLMAEWHYRDQRPQYQTWGSGGLPEVLIPNPLHKVSAPARVVEQLVLAAQGSDPGEDAWYFTGRQAVMAKLVGWVSAREPGMFVLTGPAGCGKSAVLGQLACLSDTDQRAQLLRERPLESADPGVGSVHANVSAHASSVTQLVRAIDEQLSDRGVIAGDRRGVRGRRELLNSLDLATICPVIVIDGLDEAVDEVWTILEQLLKPLAARCMLLIGTRELTLPAGGLPLTTQLQPDSARVISLLDEVDDDADIRAYVQRRLGGRDLRMSPPLVAEALLAEREHPGDGLFLLAHIVTAQLRAEPVDTAASGWHERLSHSVEEAFDHDLAAARHSSARARTCSPTRHVICWPRWPGVSARVCLMTSGRWLRRPYRIGTTPPTTCTGQCKSSDATSLKTPRWTRRVSADPPTPSLASATGLSRRYSDRHRQRGDRVLPQDPGDRTGPVAARVPIPLDVAPLPGGRRAGPHAAREPGPRLPRADSTRPRAGASQFRSAAKQFRVSAGGDSGPFTCGLDLRTTAGHRLHCGSRPDVGFPQRRLREGR